MKVDMLVLFPILGGYFQFFTTENNVCCRLIIYGLYCVEVGSFYAHFLKSFNHKCALNFVKCACSLICDSHYTWSSSLSILQILISCCQSISVRRKWDSNGNIPDLPSCPQATQWQCFCKEFQYSVACKFVPKIVFILFVITSFPTLSLHFP